MESMNYSLHDQDSTEAFRARVEAAVAKMNAGDLSHAEEDGLLVADAAVADTFFRDPRYRHIGQETVGGDEVHVFLFVRSED